MLGGRILILLLILLVATFVLRFVGTLPAMQSSPNASSAVVSSSSPSGTFLKSLTGGTKTSRPQSSAPASYPSSGQIQLQKPPQSVPAIATSAIPQGFTRSQLSPYFRKVVFSKVSLEDIILSTNFSSGDPINVTNWLIKAKRGGQAVPQAVNFYSPDGNFSEEDIRLKAGDILRMFNVTSPVGHNLRLNGCVGYLNNTISPKAGFYLPSFCPRAYSNYSEISDFTGECQNYVSSLGACQLPNLTTTRVPRDDYACQDYLKTINYKGCVDRYKSYPNFFGNKVWVWTGNPNGFLNRFHDVVQLLDTNGLVVDVYQY